MREHGKRCVGSAACTMAAVVMGVNMEALVGHGLGKAGIAAGMFGKTVADDENSPRLAGGGETAPAESRTCRASMRPYLPEHAIASPKLRMPSGYQIDLSGKGNRSLLLVVHEITTNSQGVRQYRFKVAIYSHM